MVDRETETSQTRQVPNPAQKTPSEKNEGWQAVRGKSDSKNTQATTERVVAVGNGFTVLTETYPNQISSMTSRVK